MAKKISKNGIDLIKEFEGCYLSAYKDPVGVWTIGYGITDSDKAITGTKIYAGLKISKDTAEKWLENSLNQKYVPLVLKYDGIYNWNQNELDALVSFAYNIGSIDQLTANGTRSKTTISNKLLQYNKAGGRVLKGLTRRRVSEKALFDKPYSEPIKEPSNTETKNSKSCNKKVKVIAKSGLNLRDGAGASCKLLITIPSGKTITWINSKCKQDANNNDWYKVKYSNKTGYVIAKYLRQV